MSGERGRRSPSPSPTLARLLEDHEMLVIALGEPEVWAEVLGDELAGAPLEVTDVSPVGTGQVASCLRVSFSHDAPAAPRSVVVKTGSPDPNGRVMSAALRHAEVEVSWYRNLAGDALVTCPTVHAAEVRDDGADFVIVMEDLSGSTQGDQIEGIPVEDAARAVDELAALHATSWGAAPAGHDSWLVGRGDPSAHVVLLSMLHAGFVDAYGDRLDADVLDAAERLVAVADRYLPQRPGPVSIVHGDFRPDNLLFGPDSVHVVDWQTVTVGAALGDLAYLLGGAVLPEVRREHEAELLDRYRVALAGHGVELDAHELAEGYRRYALDGLVMAIGASQVVGRTERGDAMFCAMAERAALHALEAGTFELVAD